MVCFLEGSLIRSKKPKDFCIAVVAFMLFGDGLPNTYIHVADYKSMQSGLRNVFFCVGR